MNIFKNIHTDIYSFKFSVLKELSQVYFDQVPV